MNPIDELELDDAGYPDLDFEEIDDGADAEEIELLMKCVHAARQCA